LEEEELPTSPISIRIDRPWGCDATDEDEADNIGGETASSNDELCLEVPSKLVLLEAPFLFSIMCLMEGDLDTSNDAICFIFNDPRELQDKTSCCCC
jgi:hypothetical protein